MEGTSDIQVILFYVLKEQSFVSLNSSQDRVKFKGRIISIG